MGEARFHTQLGDEVQHSAKGQIKDVAALEVYQQESKSSYSYSLRTVGLFQGATTVFFSS